MFHLMIDAYEGYKENLNNLMSVNECLVELSQRLELIPVMPPMLVPYYYGVNLEDGGISAFMLLEGVHITIHTFPYKSCYFADILAPLAFDAMDTKRCLNSIFSAKTSNVVSMVRELDIDNTELASNNENDFGPHCMIEVKDIDLSFDQIYKWLDTIAPKIGMTAITRPYVLYSTPHNPKFISGMLVVAQSHVGIHYDIKSRIAYVDIFSCVFLDSDRIYEILRNSFGNNFKCKIITRGKLFGTLEGSCNKDAEKYRDWQRYTSQVD